MEFSQELLEAAIQFCIRTMGALLLIGVAWAVSIAAGRAVQRGLERNRVDLTVARFAGKLMRWLLIVLAALACLSIFDVETTSFAALVGAAGIALGLAVQGTLSNFASGVMLLLFRPYAVGDTVTVAGVSGRVYEIDLFSTTLDTPDNRRFTVPNGSIFGSTIENVTYHPTRRIDLFIAADGAADIEKTREALTGAVNAVEGILDNPPREVALEKLGAASVDWAVRVWCDTELYASVRERTLVQVKQALEDAGVTLPSQQVAVRLSRTE